MRNQLPVNNDLAIFIVGNPDRGSLGKRIPEFERCTCVHVVPSVIVKETEFQSSELIDLHRFQVFAGRSPLAAEVGCAAAHRNAYQLFLDGESTWALIIEDDAEISNAHLLVRRVEEILNARHDEFPLIVSFYAREIRESGLGTLLVPGAHFIPISISSAVCYLLNKAAAQIIVDRQIPIEAAADWPVEPPHTDFVIDLKGLVGHLDEEQRSSTISAEIESRVGSRWNRYLIWTFLWYLIHKRTYADFAEFQRQTFKKRLYYHAFVAPKSGRETFSGRSSVAIFALLWKLIYGSPSRVRPISGFGTVEGLSEIETQ